MARWKIDDFRKPTKEIIFDLCMEDLKSYNQNFNDIKNEINREIHRDLLVKYDIQSYSDLLIDYQIRWFNKQASFHKHKKWFDRYNKEVLPNYLKISRILKMFLSRKLNNNSLGISITDLYDRIDINDTNLINQIQEVFIKEFERLELNETEYTREEALNEILKYEDPDWFIDYGPVDCFDGMYIYPHLITEELIKDYMSVHYKVRETTLEVVNDVITDLEVSVNEKKGRTGAKIKNLNIGELAKQLSYIHRIEQFLNQNKFTSIKDFPIKNETCRFVYEYFEFWDLLYDHVKFNKSEKEKRANYIKSLIRNNENLKPEGKAIFLDKIKLIDTNLELRIDLFKKVKDGLITPEVFFERLNPVQ